MSRARELVWDGCLNVRDLGGLPTEDGGETRFGAVVRADSRGRLTDAGWEALVGYGVSRIVDLRFHDELEADPPRDLPVEVAHVPLLGSRDGEDWHDLDARAAAAPTPAAATALVYESFLERRRAAFAVAVGAVADAPRGAVVVHCVGGKDRTGLVCALALRLAGVALDVVDGDYAATEPNLRAVHDEWIAAAADERERARRARIAASPAGAMQAVLAGLERRHGSVEDYLAGGGLAPAAIERLRARLRG